MKKLRLQRNKLQKLWVIFKYIKRNWIICSLWTAEKTKIFKWSKTNKGKYFNKKDSEIPVHIALRSCSTHRDRHSTEKKSNWWNYSLIYNSGLGCMDSGKLPVLLSHLLFQFYEHTFWNITNITILHQTKQREISQLVQKEMCLTNRRELQRHTGFHYGSVNWSQLFWLWPKQVLYRLVWKYQARCQNKPEARRVCALCFCTAVQTHRQFWGWTDPSAWVLLNAATHTVLN